MNSFWVQICGPQNLELDFLVDAMTSYYNQKENKELHAIREPYLGQIVAAMLLTDNKWYVNTKYTLRYVQTCHFLKLDFEKIWSVLSTF